MVYFIYDLWWSYMLNYLYSDSNTDRMWKSFYYFTTEYIYNVNHAHYIPLMLHAAFF